MVNVDGETLDTRAAEAKYYVHSHPSRSRNVGFQSEGIGNQQERVDRADSAELSYFAPRGTIADTRTADDGGSITQLIEETRQEIAQFEAHTSKLRNRLHNLSQLLDRLGQTQEE